MDISIIKVENNNRDTFMNIWQFLGYDFSELNGMDLSENGCYKLPSDINDYINHDDYSSYIIMCDQNIAGIAVIKFIDNKEVNYFRHFFIMRKYRRNRVGQNAVEEIFNMHEGKWLVSQFDYNLPAITFWRRVVSEYTKGNYKEYRRKDDKGPQQEFIKE